METTATPLRCRVSDAAAVLGVDRVTVYRKVRDGELSAMRPDGRGPGKKVYLRPGEVRAYAGEDPLYPDGGAKAARAWRKANRIPEPKGTK